MSSRQRIIREDKRGTYLNNEGIGAGAEGDQLITWGGDVDQIEVRPSPHGGKRVFIALGMLGLDPHKSPETCPQVRLTLTGEHAQQLADGIYAALGGESEQDADVRAVAEACSDFGNDEGPRGIRRLYARFADRIEALDVEVTP